MGLFDKLFGRKKEEQKREPETKPVNSSGSKFSYENGSWSYNSGGTNTGKYESYAEMQKRWDEEARQKKEIKERKLAAAIAKTPGSERFVLEK